MESVANANAVVSNLPSNIGEDDELVQFLAIDKQNEYAPKLKKEHQEFSEDIENGSYEWDNIHSDEKWYNTFRAILERDDKIREVNLVLAIIIATLTFAAAFTMPVDYRNEPDPDQGTLILSKHLFLRVYIISNAIAMVFSLSAVFLHLLISVGRSEFYCLSPYAFACLVLAMAATMIASLSGTCVVSASTVLFATAIYFIGFGILVLMLLTVSKPGPTESLKDEKNNYV